MTCKIVILGLVAMLFSNGECFSNELEIVTADSPSQEVLKKKTEEIKKDELSLAHEIGKKLHQALIPYLPAASAL